MLWQTLIAVLMLVSGLALLPFAADWLVRGSVAAATRMHVPQLVVGLTIVALGTSAPELVTGIAAVLKDAPGIVLGNAVGSNIANLTLVMGIAAVLGRIPVAARLVRFDGVVMLGLTALVMLLALDGSISRWDGLVLLLALVLLTLWAVRRGDVDPDQLQEAAPGRPLGILLMVGLLAGGIAGLAIGAEVLVRGATRLALLFGLSETLVGATVVAIGTSLPEIAASLAAARQRHYGLLLGNLIGSCQFNIAAIISIPSLIHPLSVDPAMETLHLPWLALASIVAWVIMLTGRRVQKREGALLLALYVLYLALAIVLR